MLEPDIVSNIFKYLLVDEVQDCRSTEHEIIEIFVENNINVTIIGDINQSIYGFRGGRPQLFENFPARFPSTTILKLCENFRSTQQILDLANSLVESSSSALSAPMITSTDKSGSVPELFMFENDLAECSQIVAKIQKFISDSVPMSEIAVLYRTNNVPLLLEFHLALGQIPFKRGGNRKGESFFNFIHCILHLANSFVSPPVFKQMLAFFGVSTSQRNFIASGLGSQIDLAKIKISNSIDGTIQSSICKLVSLVKKTESVKDIFAKLAEFVVKNCTENAKPKILDKVYSSFIDLVPTLTALTSVFDGLVAADNRNQDGIILSTIHGAKGLEFEKVIVQNVSEWYFPLQIQQYKNQRLLEEHILEELRILYVGVTRAKTELILTSTAYDRTKISRFLNEAITESKLKVNESRKSRNSFFFKQRGPAMLSPHAQFLSAQNEEKYPSEVEKKEYVKEDESQFRVDRKPVVFNADDSEHFERIMRANEQHKSLKRRVSLRDKIQSRKKK
ncbi:hypothetical protein GEMRC1_006516 [Eukaryota sp. GEM-RC1]